MDRGLLVKELERIAPPELALPMDEGRIGLVVEGIKDIRTVCCALDATPAVVGEAVSRGTDMLVVHHTPIWTPVTAVRGPLAPLLRAILSAGINLYVLHTNYDRAPGGVNDCLATLLGMQECQPMSEGLVGHCPLTAQGIAARLGCGGLRVVGDPPLPGRLGLLAGSGFDPAIMGEAASMGAGAFLSAELKHAVARAAPFPCLEAMHYALEAPAMRHLAGRLGAAYLDDPPAVTLVP